MRLWILRILGILSPIIVPISYIAILLFWWDEYTRIVDRESCSCSCWDTVFKGKRLKYFGLRFYVMKFLNSNQLFILGPYEFGDDTRYKHFYFNATANTAKIWILTVITIVANYECVKYLINLAIIKSIRYSMLYLYYLIAYTHYYTWWMYVNYYNDEFYRQWNHQTFFTVNIFECKSFSAKLEISTMSNFRLPN